MKILLKILLSTLLCLSLVACSSNDDSNNPGGETSENSSGGSLSGGSGEENQGGGFISGDGDISLGGDGDISYGGDGDISFGGDDSSDDGNTAIKGDDASSDGNQSDDSTKPSNSKKEYDENGKLIKETFNDYMFDWDLIVYYNEQGKAYKNEMIHDSLGKDVTIFNDSGDVSEKISYDGEGEKTQHLTYTYTYYDSGEIKMYTETSMEGTYYEEYLLESGQPYKSITRDADGNEKVEDYIYENGGVKEKKTSFPDGSFSTLTYTETGYKEVYDLGDGCIMITLDDDAWDEPKVTYFSKDGTEFDNEMDWKGNHWNYTH